MVPNSQVLQDLVQTSSTPRLATTDGLLECLEQALSSQIREVHQDLKESAINTTAFRKTKSRRERVKTIYNDYFQQNKDLFIAFFSKDPEDKTRKHNVLVDNECPFHSVRATAVTTGMAPGRSRLQLFNLIVR